VGQTEKYKPLLTQRMIRVRHIHSQRIAKNCGCFFKWNPMLAQVGHPLFRIPLEIITHELPSPRVFVLSLKVPSAEISDGCKTSAGMHCSALVLFILLDCLVFIFRHRETTGDIYTSEDSPISPSIETSMQFAGNSLPSGSVKRENKARRRATFSDLCE